MIACHLQYRLNIRSAVRDSLACRRIRGKYIPAAGQVSQRQRVAVARALVTKPSIILADEPTGNLDTKTGDEIMTLFEEIHDQGNTIILVTHEEYIAEHAKRIIRLRDGLIESDERVSRRIAPNGN